MDRRESATRKRELAEDIRARIRRGALPVGTRLPSLDELGRRYGLSKPTVLEALGPLIADQTLMTRPGVGVFVNDDSRRSAVHLLVTGQPELQTETVCRAFTSRMHELGVEVLEVAGEDLVDQAIVDDLPKLLSVFVFGRQRIDAVRQVVGSDVPIVHYPPSESNARLGMSYIDLDNAEVGRRAARELLMVGMTRIAFLGMERIDAKRSWWSEDRARGATEVVRRSSPRHSISRLRPTIEGDPLRLGPRIQRENDAIRARIASLAADRLDEFDSCIGADDRMIVALADELHARNMPERDWPVMVGAEALHPPVKTCIASVAPGWQELGSQAARILFNRVTGQPRSRQRDAHVVTATRVVDYRTSC